MRRSYSTQTINILTSLTLQHLLNGIAFKEKNVEVPLVYLHPYKTDIIVFRNPMPITQTKFSFPKAIHTKVSLFFHAVYSSCNIDKQANFVENVANLCRIASFHWENPPASRKFSIVPHCHCGHHTIHCNMGETTPHWHYFQTICIGVC